MNRATPAGNLELAAGRTSDERGACEERVLAAARILLTHFDAPMLTVATSPTQVHVVPWSDRLCLMPELTDASAARHKLTATLDEIRWHGSAVCALLAWRWPVNSAPRIVGFVTDGIGMAVSGGHPSALSDAWLTDHVAGRARIEIMLPLGKLASILLQPHSMHRVFH